MKYTFEIMKEYEDAFKGISVYSVSEDKKLMVDFVAIEELEDAQKEIDEAYQRGLDDAWEVVKALFQTFGTESACVIMKNDNVHGAIDRLKAHEEKQKAEDEIKVGDEVVVSDVGCEDTTYTVVSFGEGTACGFTYDGIWIGWELNKVTKTGRHFDIEKILEEMRE